MPGKMENFGFFLSRTELSVQHHFDYLQDGA